MIKKTVQACLGLFGLRLVRNGALPVTEPAAQYNPLRDELRPFLRAMKGLGFNPSHVIDVGANRGYWTRQALEFFPHARYTLIEPNPELKKYADELAAAGHSIEWLNGGVSDAPGTLELRVCSRDDASTFASLSPRYDDLFTHCISVEVNTLDQMLAGRPIPELVKIDAEGFDLRVLHGASSLFGKTEIFLVEVMVACPEYENRMSAVIGKMDEAGYAPLDITHLNRSPEFGVLWLCEVAFIRKGSGLLDGIFYG
jgi:FkbM family methyltransferase